MIVSTVMEMVIVSMATFTYGFQAKTRSKPMSRSYYVCHKVPSMTGQKEHISGPYETLLEAVYNYQDIKGYEHVEDVGIIMESDKPILDTE